MQNDEIGQYLYQGQPINLKGINPALLSKIKQSEEARPDKAQLLKILNKNQSLLVINRILVSAGIKKKVIQNGRKDWHNLFYQVKLDGELNSPPIPKLLGQSKIIIKKLEPSELHDCLKAMWPVVKEDEIELAAEQDIFQDVPAMLMPLTPYKLQFQPQKQQKDEQPAIPTIRKDLDKPKLKRTFLQSQQLNFYEECYNNAGPDLSELKQLGIKQSETIPLQTKREQKKRGGFKQQLQKVRRIMEHPQQK